MFGTIFLILYFQKWTNTIECLVWACVWWNHRFGPYILRSQSIWSIHFNSSQFGQCYFQLTINLDSAVNSLIENAYMANKLHSWPT